MRRHGQRLVLAGVVATLLLLGGHVGSAEAMPKKDKQACVNPTELIELTKSECINARETAPDFAWTTRDGIGSDGVLFVSMSPDVDRKFARSIWKVEYSVTAIVAETTIYLGDLVGFAIDDPTFEVPIKPSTRVNEAGFSVCDIDRVQADTRVLNSEGEVIWTALPTIETPFSCG